LDCSKRKYNQERKFESKTVKSDKFRAVLGLEIELVCDTDFAFTFTIHRLEPLLLFIFFSVTSITDLNLLHECPEITSTRVEKENKLAVDDQ
jgi:hypothetical protein